MADVYSGMPNAEIELKFPVADVGRLTARLPELGFHLETERTLEVNTLYDTATRDLRDRGEILRLRRYGARQVVTHKRHPDQEEPGTLYKVRIETEADVSDAEAMAEIFKRLGYTPMFRYEKFRTEFAQALDSSGSAFGHLVVDETAIGTWAELEGPAGWIDRMLTALGVDRASCIRDSYGRLFLNWKAATGSPAENLTFEEIGAPVLAGR